MSSPLDYLRRDSQVASKVTFSTIATQTAMGRPMLSIQPAHIAVDTKALPSYPEAPKSASGLAWPRGRSMAERVQKQVDYCTISPPGSQSEKTSLHAGSGKYQYDNAVYSYTHARPAPSPSHGPLVLHGSREGIPLAKNRCDNGGLQAQQNTVYSNYGDHSRDDEDIGHATQKHFKAELSSLMTANYVKAWKERQMREFLSRKRNVKEPGHMEILKTEPVACNPKAINNAARAGGLADGFLKFEVANKPTASELAHPHVRTPIWSDLEAASQRDYLEPASRANLSRYRAQNDALLAQVRRVQNIVERDLETRAGLMPAEVKAEKSRVAHEVHTQSLPGTKSLVQLSAYKQEEVLSQNEEVKGWIQQQAKEEAAVAILKSKAGLPPSTNGLQPEFAEWEIISDSDNDDWVEIPVARAPKARLSLRA